MRRKAWVMVGMLMAFGFWLSPLHPIKAATPSVTPPPNVQAGFYPSSPTTGASTFFNLQPTWYRMNNVGTPVRGWTIVHAGEDMQLRAAVTKNDTYWTASLSLSIQKGTDPISSFVGNWNAGGNATILALAAQYGLTYQTGYKDPAKLIVDNDVIRYEMKVPEVSQPTWYTLQINTNLTFPFTPPRMISSDLTRILVIPTNYAPTLNVNEVVLFNGQNTNLAVTGLDRAIIPDYQFTPTASLTAQISGNGLQAAAAGGVSSTPIRAKIQFAPMFGGEAPFEVTSAPAVVDTANLADVTVNENQPATFRLQLPSGLTATNTRWYVGGVLQATTSNGELVIPAAQSSANVYAISDFARGQTTVAQNVRSNSAKLNVIPARHDYDLSFSEPFLFINDRTSAQLAPTTQLKTAIIGLPQDASNIVWHAYQPDSQTPSSLVQITQDGTVSSGRSSGAVDIEADFTTASGSQVSVKRLNVVQLSDLSAAANTSLLFQAPTPPIGQLVTNAWYLADAVQRFGSEPTVIATKSVASGPIVTSAQNNRLYQLVMRVVVGDQSYTLNSNVAMVSVIPPVGLDLQSVPSFDFAKDDLAPTVADLITSDTTLTAVQGLDQLVISDTGPTAGPWQLSVAMSDFKSLATQVPLGAEKGLMQITFKGEQAPNASLVAIGVGPTIVATANAPLVVWQVAANLNLPRVSAPLAGGYEAQLNWTLAAAPTPPAP